jgi:endonuclease YncB( thermonuclease family)
MWRYVTLFLLLPAAVVLAQSLVTGEVVEVPDGDDIKIVTASNLAVRVRLSGIDAPQMGQAYAERAKEVLSEKVLHRTVRVELLAHDGYRRAVGNVFHGDRWINLEMVATGLAWHAAAALTDERLAKAEEDAREAKVGLWQESYQLPPWEYREWKLQTAYDAPPAPRGGRGEKRGGK